MECVVNIFSILTAAVTVSVLVRVLTGVVSACRFERLCQDRLPTVRGADAVFETGFSVVVVLDDSSVAEMERRMAMNYLNFEMVAVIDMVRNPSLCHILKRYSMVKVDYVPLSDVTSYGIRAVYRSRERRYHRLVIVDHSISTQANAYNCGVEMCGWDYVIPVGSSVFLRSDALNRFAVALDRSRLPRVDSIGACSVATDCEGAQTLAFTTGVMLWRERYFQYCSRIERRDTVALLDRDAVVRVGGFDSSAAMPVRNMVERMLQTNGRTLNRFVPVVVAVWETPAECRHGLCPRLLRSLGPMKLWWICAVAASIAATVIWVADGFSTVGAGVWLSLLAIVCLLPVAVGALCLGVVPLLTQRYSSRGLEPDMFSWIFFYSISRLGRIISTKNFVK